jgi:phospholipid transport system substrate-binding protein
MNVLNRWLHRSRLLAVLGSVALTLISAGPARAQTAPDEFIKSLSTEVLDKIRQDKDIKSGNPGRISEFVDSTIMPQVNFERMTSLAVGRSWRQATPEQQKRLQSEFRVLLLRTYSGALSSVRDHTVKVKPQRAGGEDGEVIVRTEVVAAQGDPIQIDYRLEKSGNSWKIFDLNVLGVWLVETYRNQFAQEINSKGIDGLIQSLTDKNKSFSQAASKKG